MRNQIKTIAIFLCSTLFIANAYISSVSAQSVPASNQVEQPQQAVDNTATVNLNESTLEQLVTLKGIGEKKAHAIIAYRQRAGDFKSIEDLLKVKGVGEKVIEDNLSRLTI